MEIDRTKKEVLSRQVALTGKFYIPLRLAIRIAVGASVLIFMAAFAYHFEQYVVMGLSLFIAAFITVWQCLYYGFDPSSRNVDALAVTNFYSKGALIFIACFWVALIGGLAIALYLKAHAP